MNKIQKLSSFMLTISWIPLIGMPLANVSSWALRGWAPYDKTLPPFYIHTADGWLSVNAETITPLCRFIGISGELIHSLPIFIGIIVLRGLFKNYRAGSIFSEQNAQKYKLIGWLFVLDAILVSPLYGRVQVLAATLSHPPGERLISLHFGSVNLEQLFCGALGIIIAWVMLEGSRLQQEQAFTI